MSKYKSLCDKCLHAKVCAVSDKGIDHSIVNTTECLYFLDLLVFNGQPKRQLKDPEEMIQKRRRREKMTVRDLIENTTCGILLTSEEDPNNCLPEIEIPANCTDTTWWLSDEVLDHEVYLITVKNGNIYASLFVGKERGK